ncbi:MAG TPA: mannose-1-phosphate guanylyltransferase [Phaeodactylibacter sp.]|nr:mannose-1-phosphate guanylyltransferase [Phaeodactylibacter sp.]
MQQNTYVAIMAGGIGSRFWPGSRESRPKQFLDILGVGKSLIRLTFERFLKLCPAENIFIVTNAIYKDLVKEHLQELSDNQILCEPSRNNTAPCIAYTAFKLQALNPEANFVVAPSDHIVLNEAAFVGYLKKGIQFVAEKEALLTLGIQPSRPDTGYGYINYDPAKGVDDIFPVTDFTEKPDAALAQVFVDSGEYLWNAGIFLWNVQSILKAFERYAPEIHRILNAKAGIYNSDEEQAFINEAYPSTPKISIDYAIMENAENVYTIPADFGWSDLGTWASLFEESDRDKDNNVINGNEVITYNTTSCLIRVPNDKLVIIKDLDDYIVIDEGDVLLIHPKSKEQEIKAITQALAKDKRKFL